jgi:hypothetical protein
MAATCKLFPLQGDRMKPSTLPSALLVSSSTSPLMRGTLRGWSGGAGPPR